jgi:pimeloyl-ACP methyl ester carboxylesterase
MAQKKPYVVLVHGAWHVPASYDKLAIALRSFGYDICVPHLTSMSGTNYPNGDLITDTALIRSCVEGLVEASHNVVVLMHSYGGQVGTNALDNLSSQARIKQGLRGGVANIIYICAFILPEGWSTLDQAKARGIENERALKLMLKFDDDGYCTMAEPREQLINNFSDDAEAEAYISKLVPWNTKCMHQPLSHCAWREIPVTYIHTTHDRTVTLASQQLMLERLKGHDIQDPLLVTLDTDHFPHLTATEKVLDVVNTAVAAV